MLRMENTKQIYHKHKINGGARARFLGKNIQISIKNYFQFQT